MPLTLHPQDDFPTEGIQDLRLPSMQRHISSAAKPTCDESFTVTTTHGLTLMIRNTVKGHLADSAYWQTLLDQVHPHLLSACRALYILPEEATSLYGLAAPRYSTVSLFPRQQTPADHLFVLEHELAHLQNRQWWIGELLSKPWNYRQHRNGRRLDNVWTEACWADLDYQQQHHDFIAARGIDETSLKGGHLLTYTDSYHRPCLAPYLVTEHASNKNIFNNLHEDWADSVALLLHSKRDGGICFLKGTAQDAERIPFHCLYPHRAMVIEQLLQISELSI